MSVFPTLLENQTGQINLAEKAKEFAPYFSIEFPPLFGVMPALIFSFLFGIGLSRLKNSTFGNFADDFETIITYLIKNLIIPLLPFLTWFPALPVGMCVIIPWRVGKLYVEKEYDGKKVHYFVFGGLRFFKDFILDIRCIENE